MGILIKSPKAARAKMTSEGGFSISLEVWTCSVWRYENKVYAV